LLAKLSIPSSLAKYFRTVLPTPSNTKTVLVVKLKEVVISEHSNHDNKELRVSVLSYYLPDLQISYKNRIDISSYVD